LDLNPMWMNPIQSLCLMKSILIQCFDPHRYVLLNLTIFCIQNVTKQTDNKRKRRKEEINIIKSIYWIEKMKSIPKITLTIGCWEQRVFNVDSEVE
jgi:hypothetical protein